MAPPTGRASRRRDLRAAPWHGMICLMPNAHLTHPLPPFATNAASGPRSKFREPDVCASLGVLCQRESLLVLSGTVRGRWCVYLGVGVRWRRPSQPGGVRACAPECLRACVHLRACPLARRCDAFQRFLGIDRERVGVFGLAPRRAMESLCPHPPRFQTAPNVPLLREQSSEGTPVASCETEPVQGPFAGAEVACSQIRRGGTRWRNKKTQYLCKLSCPSQVTCHKAAGRILAYSCFRARRA